jgi:FecR protein
MSQPDDWGDQVVQPITLRVTAAAQCWRHLSSVLLVTMLNAAVASAGPPTLDVMVTSVQGEVQVTGQARRLEVHKGDVLPLPATIYTGPSGSIELRQGNTTLSAAPNSQLMIPAPAVPGEAIDRVIQSRGNAFYNVAKRATSKLHVESAYLVAVIKGTQFSVVAQDDSATISLYEGRLEVRATDGSDIVDLQAGEIAVRHANDGVIRMLRMDSGEPLAHRAPAPSPAAAAGAAGLPAAGSSNPTGGDAGSLRGTSADSGSGSAGSGPDGIDSGRGTLGSGSASFSGGVATSLASVSTSASAVGIAVNPGNKSANGNSGSDPNSGKGQGGANNGNGQGASNNGNGHGASGSGNGQGASNNGNGQGASDNGNGQGASNNGNGQGASNNGNGQGASGNGNGQGASNNGNGQGASGNGNGQNASNNGNGQNASNNGNGQGGSNNGNGQGGSNNGHGHGGSNKVASGRSPNFGSGPAGLIESGTLSRAITTSISQAKGTNLGTGAPVGSAASSNPVGGLLGAVTRHKGSPGQP